MTDRALTSPSVSTGFLGAAAALTLVGVPAGLALTGGDVSWVHTLPLTVSLAGMVLASRRWPVSALLLALCSVLAFRTGP